MNLALTMKVDNATLEKSLAKARKAFGESTEQALYRWGVQVARELAGVTQAYGKSKTLRDKQSKAIYMDAMNVCRLVTSNPQLKNASQCFEWIERHRTRKRRRTARISEQEKKTVTADILNQALVEKFKRIGMAKGAWLGAGIELDAKQHGTEKINIGKNFLAYAQKWRHLGNAIVGRKVFSPTLVLENKATHSASNEVLPDSRKKTTVKRGLINTLKWYDKATTAKLAKI